MTENHYAALIQKADHFLEIKRPREAITFLRQASALEPNESAPYERLTWAYLSLGEKLEAYRAVKRTVELAPDEAWSYATLAEFHRANMNGDPALKAATEAVRLAPEDPTILQVLCLAEILCNRLAEARWTAEHILKLAPQWSMAYTLLGHVCTEEGKKKDAQKHFDEALRRDPASSQGHANLGRALKKLGQTRFAIERLEEAVRLNPQSLVARRDLTYELNKHLIAWKWLGAVFVLVALFLLQLGLRSWTEKFMWLSRAMIWMPLVGAALFLLMLSIIQKRREARIDPNVVAYYHSEKRRFLRTFLVILFLHIGLPGAVLIALYPLLKKIEEPGISPGHLILFSILLIGGSIGAFFQLIRIHPKLEAERKRHERGG